MKRIVLIILLSIITTIVCSGQTTSLNGFRIKNDHITWRKIFFFEGDSLAFANWFEENFDVKRMEKDRIVASSRLSVLPYESVGYKEMSVILIFRKPCIVYFTVDFRPGRYRVTVNNIIWDTNTSMVSSHIAQGLGTVTLDDFVKKGDFSKAFRSKASMQLDDMLKYLFIPKFDESVNDRW